MINFFEHKYLDKSFQRETTRLKIDWQKNSKQLWVRKSYLKCNVAFTCAKIDISYVWYFDRGCSKHMASSLLVDYKVVSEGVDSIGDGVKGRVLGKGNLNVKSLPRLRNMIHVEGLKANLISTSHICD